MTAVQTRTRTETTPSEVSAPQQGDRRAGQLSPFMAWAAALLALAVAWIHVLDQGGLPGSKDPSYVGWGYWALELIAVLVAAALVFKRTRGQLSTWLAAAAVAVGPLTGYVLSRGPGLPGYTDDRGNWAEPIGLLSLIVEGLLLLLAISRVRTLRRSGGAPARI